MNHKITTKKDILATAKTLMIKEGIDKLNMRKIASGCNIALGSFYNYYPSKKELMVDLITYIWSDIFKMEELESDSLIDLMDLLIEKIAYGKKNYPSFFKNHFLGFDKNDLAYGQNGMIIFMEKFKKHLLFVMESDKKISKDIFNQDFTKEDAVNFVMSLIFSMFISNLESRVYLFTIKKLFY